MQKLGYFGSDVETLRSDAADRRLFFFLNPKFSSFYLSSLTLLAGLCWTLLEISKGFLVLLFPGKCVFPGKSKFLNDVT